MKRLLFLSLIVTLTSLSLHAGVGENMSTADCGDINNDQTESQISTGSHDAAVYGSGTSQ